MAFGFTGGCVSGTEQWSATNYLATPNPTTTLAAAPTVDALVVTASDGLHILRISTGASLAKGSVGSAAGRLRDPILVGDRIYVMDASGLLALQTM